MPEPPSSPGAGIRTSSNTLWGLALCADFVLANTVVEARRYPRPERHAPVPVLWWLHDAFAGYPHIAHQIPKHSCAQNVQLYSVGKHAAAAMHSVRPQFDIRPLIYGLPDYAAEDFPRCDLGYPADKPLFATVGSFERRKGQDIFCTAIRLLPDAVREQGNLPLRGQSGGPGDDGRRPHPDHRTTRPTSSTASGSAGMRSRT